MASGRKDNLSPRILNRRATHEFFIESKLECGIELLGSEVKSIRYGRAQLQDSYAAVENGQLVLYQCHIDPYALGNATHVPTRTRRLLAHRREIKKLEAVTKEKGTTLIPLSIYFSKGLAKVEIGVAKGKQQFDKRAAIRKKEQDRDLRRIMSRRG